MYAGITLKQMEAFYWIARLGSFSAAATRLNTTQPGISGRIRDLETLLRTELFDRSGRNAVLTPSGRNLLDIAEGFVDLTAALVERTGFDQSLRGVVRMGAADSVALTWLPALISDLSERFPHLVVELVVDLSLHLQAKLAEGELDIAFLVGGPPRPDFDSVPIGSVRNAWMCSPRLGLLGRPITPADLAAGPILTHSRGSHLHQAVEAWFEEAGARPARLHCCNSLATLVELTVAGLGVSVLPPTMLADRMTAGQLGLIDIDLPVPPNRFSVIFPRRPASTLSRTIVEMAKAAVAGDPAFEIP